MKKNLTIYNLPKVIPEELIPYLLMANIGTTYGHASIVFKEGAIPPKKLLEKLYLGAENFCVIEECKEDTLHKYLSTQTQQIKDVIEVLLELAESAGLTSFVKGFNQYNYEGLKLIKAELDKKQKEQDKAMFRQYFVLNPADRRNAA